MNWIRVNNLDPYLPMYHLCKESRVYRHSGHVLLTRIDELVSNVCYVPESSPQYAFEESRNQWNVDYNTIPVLIHTTMTWILIRPGDWGVWYQRDTHFWDITPVISTDCNETIRMWHQRNLISYDISTNDSYYTLNDWDDQLSSSPSLERSNISVAGSELTSVADYVSVDDSTVKK